MSGRTRDLDILKSFVQSFHLFMKEIVIKISAKLAKVKEIAPWEYQSEHFPPELLLVIGNYVKI